MPYCSFERTVDLPHWQRRDLYHGIVWVLRQGPRKNNVAENASATFSYDPDNKRIANVQVPRYEGGSQRNNCAKTFVLRSNISTA